MESVFEKIKDRLEELIEETYNKAVDGDMEAGIKNMAYHRVKGVVNQVAEEYNDGWIPCSERLPEVFEDTKSSDVVLICGYDKQRDYHWQAMGFYVKTEAVKRWFFAECKNTDKPIDWIDIVAWQPTPAPYQPKGEQL